MNKLVLILFNKLSKKPKDDEADVIEQVNLVANALKNLKYKVQFLQMDMNLQAAIKNIRRIEPDIIFNLVESIGNKGEFTFLANSILNNIQIPYTGSPLIPMFYCSNKVLTKKELNAIGVKTPEGFNLQECHKLIPQKKYILKPIWEEGSLELDEDCVFMGDNLEFIEKISQKSAQHYFIEEYVEGREFNISILYNEEGPDVLPLAEMTFDGYPEEKPKMMGYKSKWDETSFEYSHTQRTFDLEPDDAILQRELTEICRKCWNSLGLKGYVRIDFRVTPNGSPLVIDVNLNPCLSESSGFMAASKERGLNFEQVVEQILADAIRK
ncbi:MAG: ATP-grasp domain-containing protein [Bacteroidetes bacterium]|nr:ATP-grasp domain-containing protein [Bacteroidota bacterium]